MLERVNFVFLVSSCVGGALALTSGLLGPGGQIVYIVFVLWRERRS